VDGAPQFQREGVQRRSSSLRRACSVTMIEGRLAQRLEHPVYTRKVLRSNRRSPTTWCNYRGDVVQLVRTLPCHGRGRGFESRRPRHSSRASRRSRRVRQPVWRLATFGGDGGLAQFGHGSLRIPGEGCNALRRSASRFKARTWLACSSGYMYNKGGVSRPSASRTICPRRADSSLV
jgi:hypothetical protein